MSDPVYKRVLIKISGEALAGDNKTGSVLRTERAISSAFRPTAWECSQRR